MSDNTADTFRSLMETTFEIAPQAPELPQVIERSPVSRPMLAVAGGFAAVLLFVGVGAALVTRSANPPADHPSAGVAGQEFSTSDGYIVVAIAADDLHEPPAEVVEALRARPEVTEVFVVNKDQAEAEFRSVIADHPALLQILDENPGLLPASVRVRVESEQDQRTVNGFAAALPGVFGTETYLGVVWTLPDEDPTGETDAMSPDTTLITGNGYDLLLLQKLVEVTERTAAPEGLRLTDSSIGDVTTEGTDEPAETVTTGTIKFSSDLDSDLGQITVVIVVNAPWDPEIEIDSTRGPRALAMLPGIGEALVDSEGPGLSITWPHPDAVIVTVIGRDIPMDLLESFAMQLRDDLLGATD